MAKILPLADELDEAADNLELLPNMPSRCPRAVNLLRAKAAALRGKGNPSAAAQGKQGRKRSVKAHVGRSGKGGDFVLAQDRLEYGD